ncbi:MAG: hypothetical protein GTO02_10915 [Candidatus Dadabacteria bacterium]|nr:hypothetical protein [Candidatus Dadabacteria bacterium]NIQ14874.1 hypothetical protein [Candidatus Dadabacteria bacterium]
MQNILNKKELQCIHCGNYIKGNNYIENNNLIFCCSGCMNVYDLIKVVEDRNQNNNIDSELKSEYQFLDNALFSQKYTDPEDDLKMNFYVEGIKCLNCLASIEKISQNCKSIDNVTVNLSNNTATVNFKDKHYSTFPDEVKKLGFTAHPIKIDENIHKLKNSEKRKDLIRLAVAGVCAGNIMLLSAAIYSGADGLFKEVFTYINLLLSIPVISYCSLPFYKNTLSTLSNKKASVDFPIVVVIMTCFSWSLFNIVTGKDNIYLDSISVFIFLILLSRYLLDNVKDKYSSNLNSSLLSGLNNKVLRWDRNENKYADHPSDELVAGDKIRVLKNQQVPAD